MLRRSLHTGDLVLKFINNKKRDKRGAALAEYAVLVGLISVVSITAVTQLGDRISEVYDEVAEEISDISDPTEDTDTGDEPTGEDEPDVSPTYDPDIPENPGDCQVIPDDQELHLTSSYPGASCFTHLRGSGGTDLVEDDNPGQRPVFLNNEDDAWDYFYYEGNESDNMLVIDGRPVGTLYDAGGGFDTLVLKSIQSDEISFGKWENGETYLDNGYSDHREIYVNFYSCSVENIIFADKIVTKEEYQVLGDFDCNNLEVLPPPPPPPPPPGFEEPDFEYANGMDGCIIHTSDWESCVWTGKKQPLPEGVIYLLGTTTYYDLDADAILTGPDYCAYELNANSFVSHNGAWNPDPNDVDHCIELRYVGHEDQIPHVGLVYDTVEDYHNGNPANIGG